MCVCVCVWCDVLPNNGDDLIGQVCSVCLVRRNVTEVYFFVNEGRS